MAIFVLIFSTVGYFVLVNFLTQIVVRDNMNIQKFISNNFHKHYQEELVGLKLLAKMPGLMPFDLKKAGVTAEEYLKFDNVFSTIHVYDVDKNLLFAKHRANTPAYKIEKKINDKDNPTFGPLAERVLREGVAEASPTVFTSSGQLLQIYVVPIFASADSKTPSGLITGGVFPAVYGLDYMVEGLNLSEDNFFFVADLKQNVVARSGSTMDTLALDFPAHMKRSVSHFAEHPTDDFYLDETIPAYYVFSMPLRDLKLIVFWGVSTHHIVQKKKDLMIYLLVAVALGVVLSSLGSYYLANRLAGPLQEIYSSVEGLTQGDFSKRIRYGGNDELGHLCDLINRFAIKLRKDRFIGDLWSTRNESKKDHRP